MNRNIQILGGGRCPINGEIVRFYNRKTRKTYTLKGDAAKKFIAHMGKTPAFNGGE